MLQEFKRCLGFARLNRWRFIAFHFPVFVITVLAGLVVEQFSLIGNVKLFAILSIAALPSLFAIKFAAQRYRDVGASGFWAVFMLTPASPILFLLLSLVKGSENENKYGEAPPETPVALKITAIIFTLLVIALFAGVATFEYAISQ